LEVIAREWHAKFFARLAVESYRDHVTLLAAMCVQAFNGGSSRSILPIRTHGVI
jgi:hypothetical protein